MSQTTLPLEVETLVRELLYPFEMRHHPPVALAIAASVLTEAAIPSQALRCELVWRENATNPVFDALEVNGLVCGFDGNQITYGWDMVISAASSPKDAHSNTTFANRYIHPHNLDRLMGIFPGATQEFEDLISQNRATVHAWQLNQGAHPLPRSTRRVGL